ncbi:hypothetical protein NM688_g6956 [Phlebia brevispora]|uniref:Uncharacterized protein n=1 Tax=Phlebia brevispora TaxID=194682 RepID=A0ACC1SAI1_9APHY|nr:hypothetical protein NM688_g6956 [Phlebia brevispora]
MGPASPLSVPRSIHHFRGRWMPHRAVDDQSHIESPPFFQAYVADGHRNILISGAIVGSVIRDLYKYEPGYAQQQVPRAVWKFTLLIASFSIFTTAVFMNQLKYARSPRVRAIEWSLGTSIEEAKAGNVVHRILLLPFIWSFCAGVLCASYKVTATVYPLIDCETSVLCTAAWFDTGVNLGMTVFTVIAFGGSCLAVLTVVQVGRRDTGLP